MNRLALLIAAASLAGCASGTYVESEPVAPEFSVVDASRDAVTIRSTADADDPFIVAEAQRVCGAFGSSAEYLDSHDSDEVNSLATALMGIAGSSRVSYIPDHLFLCRQG